jgi:GT2 family glycosyltransferase
MSMGFQLWLAAAVLIGLLWVVRAVILEAALRNRQVLGDRTHDAPPQPSPRVSIILAAKDEERNIEACIASLITQDYPDFEVIVVDDRSSDRTPVILRRLEKQHPDRLRVLRVDSLPDGWFGKHNAVRLGVAASTGEWMLFTDADCRQTSRRTLSLAMRDAIEHRVQFLSIIPTLEARTIWERIVQPVCAVVLIAWFRPGRVNDPRLPTAYANGAFMLMSRSCYNDIGGHEAVRTRINEDIHLARLAKRRGWWLRVVENDGLYLVRMYDSFAGAFHGWSRIFYGCLERPVSVASALSMVVVSVAVPWMSLLVAAAGVAVAPAGEGHPWKSACLAWGAVVVLLQIVTGRLYSAVGYGFTWSLTYVLGGGVTIGILFNALLKALGLTRTTWRQTTYSPSFSAGDRAALSACGSPAQAGEQSVPAIPFPEPRH